DLDSVRGAMLSRAMAEKRSVASDPIPLLRANGPIGVIVAAPVIPEGTSEPAGFVTFSYELASLMLTNDDMSLFSVALRDPRKTDRELIANDQGVVSERTAEPDGIAPSSTRTVSFGARDWQLSYYAKTNSKRRAEQTAAIVAAIGLAITAMVCG